jgi:hypothetical protein
MSMGTLTLFTRMLEFIEENFIYVKHLDILCFQIALSVKDRLYDA